MRILPIISHAQWDPARAGTLVRLLASLGTQEYKVLESPSREHANRWSTRVWHHAEDDDRDLVVFLNDDVIAHPDMLDNVGHLAALLPGEVLSLHCQFPAIRAAANAGHRLAKCYWPSGPAYAMTPKLASELLSWLDTTPAGWFGADVNEDGAIAAWLWSRQTPAYCTIPALVRHDTSVPSTLGYDNHPHRSSPVDWADFPLRPWTEQDVNGSPYIPVPWMSDIAMRDLGDALRGIVPLCGLCGNTASRIVNSKRKTGICVNCVRVCASHVT